MTQTTGDYLARIAPEHSTKPRFVATVGLSVDPLARMQAALAALSGEFDLDAAVGPQLDAVGVRVGRSRLVPYPLQGLFFSFDDPVRGWDQGVWKGPYDVGTSIFRLDDDTYRRLLRAKILANTWDGTVEGEEAIYAAYFTDPATLVFVSDDTFSSQPPSYFAWDDPARGWDQGSWAPDLTAYFSWDYPSRGWDEAPWAPAGITGEAAGLPAADMRLTVGFAGKIPTIIDLAILNEGLIGAKPEGVTLDYQVTSVDGAPLFGFDLDNAFVSGWDTGAWGVAPLVLIDQSPQSYVPGTLDFTFADASDLIALL